MLSLHTSSLYPRCCLQALQRASDEQKKVIEVRLWGWGTGRQSVVRWEGGCIRQQQQRWRQSIRRRLRGLALTA